MCGRKKRKSYKPWRLTFRRPGWPLRLLTTERFKISQAFSLVVSAFRAGPHRLVSTGPILSARADSLLAIGSR